jgi:hypothetical protein
MGPMLVNTKQKVAVLASGLVIATTGFVTDSPAATTGDPEHTAAKAPPAVSAVAPSPRRA